MKRGSRTQRRLTTWPKPWRRRSPAPRTTRQSRRRRHAPFFSGVAGWGRYSWQRSFLISSRGPGRLWVEAENSARVLDEAPAPSAMTTGFCLDTWRAGATVLAAPRFGRHSPRAAADSRFAAVGRPPVRRRGSMVTPRLAPAPARFFVCCWGGRRGRLGSRRSLGCGRDAACLRTSTRIVGTDMCEQCGAKP